MLIQPTLDTLNRLKLYGMATALAEQLTQSAAASLGFEERFGLLLDREVVHRDNRRLARLLQVAALKERACLEDVDFRARRGLDRSQLASLASCDWIRAAQNLVIHGATGCGKTFLACAFAHQACRQGLSALYLRAPRLFEELRLCHADGSFRKRLAAIAKVDLVLIDDCVGARSTLLTSQLPLDHWHDYIGDPTLADAILDRLLHNAHKIHLEGESMRKHAIADESKSTAKRKKLD